MSGPLTRRRRGTHGETPTGSPDLAVPPGLRLRTAAALLAAVAVLLACAGPAAAGRQKVVSGSAAFRVPSARVTSLTEAHVAVIDVPPVAFRFIWDGAVGWWYKAPAAPGGTFDYAARKGMLPLKGGLRFVNVATGANLPLTGLRAYVNGPSSVVLQAAVGGPPVTRADVMVSAGSASFAKKGKVVTVRGVQFRPTPQLAVALQTALVGSLDTTSVVAVADLSFKLK
jgi:hypothetical protein